MGLLDDIKDKALGGIKGEMAGSWMAYIVCL
jgi:hypothetical protein